MGKLEIVCLSTQLWDDPMWTNKQHVMSRLAARGHEVLYVDPLIRVRMLANNLVFKHRYSPHRLFTFRKTPFPHLTVLSPVKFLFSQKQEREFNLKLIRKELKRLKMTSPVLWVYDPEFADYVAEIPHRLLIYDCVDDYSSMPAERYPEKKMQEIVDRDVKLTMTADLVFTTSKRLYESRRELNSATYYTPNVADFEHNSKALDPVLPLAEDVEDLPHPIIGFQGNLSAYKFDLPLIEELVKSRPEWSFVFVGPTETSRSWWDLRRFSLVNTLKQYKNVHLTGVRPYATLPAYYKAFDVAIMPNIVNDYNASSFPLKFFEFLGAGLPVVMTRLPALAEYVGTPGVYVAEGPAQFLACLDLAVAKGKMDGVQERLLLAKKNSWENKVDTMLGIIDKELRLEN